MFLKGRNSLHPSLPFFYSTNIMAHLLCVRHCATILYLEYNIEKNGYDVCVLTAKGIVEVAHTTQVIILINLCYNSYNKILQKQKTKHGASEFINPNKKVSSSVGIYLRWGEGKGVFLRKQCLSWAFLKEKQVLLWGKKEHTATGKSSAKPEMDIRIIIRGGKKAGEVQKTPITQFRCFSLLKQGWLLLVIQSLA